MKGFSRVAAALAAFVPMACGDDPVGLQPHPERIEILPAAGLEQVVILSGTRFAQGDTVEVRSTVHASSDAAAEVEARICGLDLLGLQLQDPFARCGGYSMRTQLAPGDSLLQRDARIIDSGPGSYTLRVRHLVAPDTWVDIPVEVVPRTGTRTR